MLAFTVQRWHGPGKQMKVSEAQAPKQFYTFRFQSLQAYDRGTR